MVHVGRRCELTKRISCFLLLFLFFNIKLFHFIRFSFFFPVHQPNEKFWLPLEMHGLWVNAERGWIKREATFIHYLCCVLGCIVSFITNIGPREYTILQHLEPGQIRTSQ